jgi:hypothetical protein
MDPIDSLPPDLNAVLSLLLRQGRSYGEIADMLHIPERSVRERAHAALDAIAAGPAVESAPAPRSGPPPRPRARPARPAGAGASRSEGSPPQPRASRRAGALLLGAIVVVVAVVAIVLASSGGSGGSHNASSSSTTSASTSGSATSANAGEPHIDKQLDLIAAEPSSKAVGLVEVLSQSNKLAFLLSAEHLPATTGNGFFYAAWLYNSPSDARLLGRAPSVSSNGQLQAVGALPSNAGDFHQILLTRETTTKPSHPGPTVLSGPFSLH